MHGDKTACNQNRCGFYLKSFICSIAIVIAFRTFESEGLCSQPGIPSLHPAPTQMTTATNPELSRLMIQLHCRTGGVAPKSAANKLPTITLYAVKIHFLREFSMYSTSRLQSPDHENRRCGYSNQYACLNAWLDCHQLCRSTSGAAI